LVKFFGETALVNKLFFHPPQEILITDQLHEIFVLIQVVIDIPEAMPHLIVGVSSGKNLDSILTEVILECLSE
jgi:hypothetical protein